MNTEFLIRPAQLNQAFETKAASGGLEDSGITRRSFIKRTGGATVATLVAWNMTIAQSRADGEGAGGGSWGMICIWPPFEDSSVDWVSPAIPVQQRDVPENTSGDVAYFHIRVVVDSNTISDPPSLRPYNECNVSYTATITILSGDNPYVDYFVDYRVTCEEDSGWIRWSMTYCNWDSDEKSITVGGIGDFDVAEVEINIERNSGNPLAFILTATYIDTYYNRMHGPYFNDVTPSMVLYEGVVEDYTFFEARRK